MDPPRYRCSSREIVRRRRLPRIGAINQGADVSHACRGRPGLSTSSASSSGLPLLALAMASFGIGTTEFVIMGLLPDVAGDLGVSIPKAGLLVSGYALGVTFGAPIVAVATARLERRS